MWAHHQTPPGWSAYSPLQDRASCPRQESGPFLEKPPPPLSLQYTHLCFGAVLALHAAVPGTSTPVHAARHHRPSSAPATPNQLLPPGEAVPPPEAPSFRRTLAVRGRALTSCAPPPPPPPAFPPRAGTWAATQARPDCTAPCKAAWRPKQTWARRSEARRPSPPPPPRPPHLPAATWSCSCYGSRRRPSAQPRRSRSGRAPRRGGGGGGGGGGGVPSPRGGGRANWNPRGTPAPPALATGFLTRPAAASVTLGRRGPAVCRGAGRRGLLGRAPGGGAGGEFAAPRLQPPARALP